MRTLSKSDFKLGRTCATKIYYKENRFPQRTDDDPFLAFLAEGGYMVEQLARMLYPDGLALEYGRDPVKNWNETRRLLQQDRVTLFEATLFSGCRQARVDILRKDGHRFELIEVKSKSLAGGGGSDDPGDENSDGTPSDDTTEPMIGKRGAVLAKWRPYVEDVAFQTALFRELFPGAEVTPYLLVVNKSVTCSTDRFPSQFRIERDVVDADGDWHDLIVTFIGDPVAIAPGEFLVRRDVSAEVALVAPGVAAATAALERLYDGDTVARAEPRLQWLCGSCEFRVAGGVEPNGFLACWGDHGRQRHHLLDLWNGGHVARHKPWVQELIDARRVTLTDVPVELLGAPREDGTGLAHRQVKQIESAQSGAPYVDDRLLELIAGLPWPLHFVDFETLGMAVPPFRGMHPYERVAFQWSCHSVAGPEHAPVHHEWLAEDRGWPHREFVASLRKAIGDHGTVLTWSPYEATTLRAILRQNGRCGDLGAELVEWVDALLHDADRGGRIVDLERPCRRFYLHPEAGGRTSIKPLLDAVWRTEPGVPAWYRAWAGRPVEVVDGAGPYESLRAVTVDDIELDVHEGTGAANAYRRMLFDPVVVGEVLATYRELLLRYCELDTLAMALIWRSWREALSAS